MLLVQELAASQGGAGDGMSKRLGLGLRGRRGSQGSLGLGGRCGRREEGDLLADGATEVVESLGDVGWVVVGFLRVLVTDRGGMSARNRGRRPQGRELELMYSRHSQHLLVDLLQGIDTLLEVDVVGWELGLPRGRSSACESRSVSLSTPLTLSSV